MANIVVKDLADSIELDQQAMSVIFGGARSRRAGVQLQQQQKGTAEKSKHFLMDHAFTNQRRGR